MDLVVLNVAYPFAAVGPDVSSGAEYMLTQLDAALTRAGHESFVMACEGSVTEGILLATPRPSEAPEAERHRIHEQYRFTLRTFVEKWPIDLIHMHGADFYEYLPPPGVPVLVTLHLPVDQYPETIFHLDRPQTFLQCISARQRSGCPPCANLLPEIEDDLAPGPAEATHAVRSRGADGCPPIEKYFSVYEQLVGEARALQTVASGYGGQPVDALHA
jgi:hypothetical protein